MPLGSQAVTVTTFFTSLAFVCLLLRCISRFGILRRVGTDDKLAILAFISSAAMTVLIAIQNKHGLGHDIDKLSAHQILRVMQAMWASIIAYGFGLTLAKLSALFQFLRFILHGRMKAFNQFMIIIVSAFGLVSTILNIFSCTPISFAWDKGNRSGSCINLVVWWYFAAVFIVITDIAVVAIPIITFKDIRLAPRPKIMLIMVFALGGFGCTFSIVRIQTVYVMFKTQNITKYNTYAAIWSSIEVNIGIICVCLPPLKPLLNLQSRLSRTTTRKNSTALLNPPSDPDQAVQQHYDFPSFPPKALVTVNQLA